MGVLPHLLEPVPDDLVEFATTGAAEWPDVEDGAMQERSDRLATTGAAPGIGPDLPSLIQEHAQRQTWLPRALAQQVCTDWDAVRAGASIPAQYQRLD